MLPKLWLLNYVNLHSSQGHVYGLLIILVSFCTTGLQGWDCRFVCDMLCLSRCILVRAFIYMFICLWVWDHRYKNYSTSWFKFYCRVYVWFVCVYVSMTYMSVGMGPQT